MSQQTDDELKDIAQRQAAGGPQPGEIYRHYKGGLYSIVARAIKEDTLEPLVIYRSNAKGTTWARTLENFTEDLWLVGHPGPSRRFRREVD
jgi:hypothetical protein